MFASVGLMLPPCTVPSSVSSYFPSTSTPTFRYFRTNHKMLLIYSTIFIACSTVCFTKIIYGTLGLLRFNKTNKILQNIKSNKLRYFNLNQTKNRTHVITLCIVCLPTHITIFHHYLVQGCQFSLNH